MTRYGSVSVATWFLGSARHGVLFFLSLAASAAPLSIDDAIRAALDHNASLAYGKLGVERKRLGVTSATQAFAPEVSPNGAVNTVEGDTGWRYGIHGRKKLVWGTEIGLAAEVNHYPAFVDENWRSAVKLDVRQPLFRNFGRLVQEEGITAAAERLRAEERRWELQKADIIVDVVRSFETIVRLQRQADCDKAILERTERLRELTRIRERQGRVSPVDTLRVDLLHGQAQSRQETHREELFSASRELAELLGLPPDNVIELEVTPLPEMDVPPIEAAIQTSLSNRLDFAQVLDDYRSLKRQARLARRKLEPDIALVAANEQYGQGKTFADSAALDENLWSVGLAGQMDLLRYQDKTAVSASELDVEAAGEAIRIKARSIAREVQQAVSAYRQARAELVIAGRNYDSARSRADLARRLFEMGRGDNFSAADAENAFVEAESALLASRARTCIAGYNLLRLVGTLTETPLALKPLFTESPL